MSQLREPRNKDERRIYDIVKKSMPKHLPAVVSPDPAVAYGWKMMDLARQMNAKITDEDKRRRRAEACLEYGLVGLSRAFAPAWAGTRRPEVQDPHLEPGATPE